MASNSSMHARLRVEVPPPPAEAEARGGRMQPGHPASQVQSSTVLTARCNSSSTRPKALSAIPTCRGVVGVPGVNLGGWEGIYRSSPDA
eukprot:198418-Prorocentrum_minimum.AAC.2